jgi:hypothetical protein
MATLNRVNRFRPRWKVNETDGFAPRGKLVSREHLPRKRVGHRARKLFERLINNPPHYPRTDAANRFVDWNDAADFGRVRVAGAEQFVFRINHLNPAGPVRVQISLPVKDDPLPRLEFLFEIISVKELAGERP